MWAVPADGRGSQRIMNRVIRFREERVNRTLLKCITPGDRLRLRDDFLRHVHPREWIFKRVESDGRILLVDESGEFGWSVKTDDIDWDAYKKEKDKRLSPAFRKAV